MNSLSYADIISTLALSIAIGAFVWNIIRDFLMDRVAVDFFITFGEVRNIKDSASGLFLDAGSLLPDHKFDNPSTLVLIINTGRKPIGVSTVGGQYKTGEHFNMAVKGLPKMLQPYETFSNTSDAPLDFIENVQKNKIKGLWTVDTKGKKWLLSAKGWERLKKTADYIASNKHR